MDRSGRLGLIPLYASILAGLIFVSAIANGQLTRPGSPLPLNYSGLKPVAIYEFQVSMQEKRKAAAATEGSMLKPARSGILIDAALNTLNAGTWDTLANGTRIWRCGIHVEDARLMSVILKPFQVNSGVRVFIYDPLQQNVLGAFSDLNNKASLILATGQIPSETIIIEVQVPAYADSPASLMISRIGCDFSEKIAPGSKKDGWFGLSGNCNVDINCLDDPGYRVVKNAVVRIVFLGSERCTGTLLNNVFQDGRNYVLTAEHCINSEEEANTALFYFSYESPYCSGPDGSSAKSVSGATLRASGNHLDFSLLELLEPVPVFYHPYYAGWDNTVTPPVSGYTIHHPLGDVKKISIANDPVIISDFGDLYVKNSHWLVSRWQTGTTEAGSSGSGFFDPADRLRGSLTGGLANCASSVNDYFQMFSHDWKDDPLSGHQLSYWLDPLNSKTSRLDGYDPYAGFWKTGDTLSNISSVENLALDNQNLAWGYWSGHNSIPIRQFAEHFSQTGSKMVFGMILHVAHNYVAGLTSALTIKIWKDQSVPGSLVYEKEIPLADLSPGRDNFIEFDSVVSITDSFFAGYELYYNNPVDTFSVYMAGNRPLDGLNTAYVYDFEWQSLENHTGGLIRSSFGIRPVVYDSVSNNDDRFEFTSDILIHPNPANDFCQIEFKEIQKSRIQLKVYNLQGAFITGNEYEPYQRSIRLETSKLRAGIYIVRAISGNHISKSKLVIVR